MFYNLSSEAENQGFPTPADLSRGDSIGQILAEMEARDDVEIFHGTSRPKAGVCGTGTYDECNPTQSFQDTSGDSETEKILYLESKQNDVATGNEDDATMVPPLQGLIRQLSSFSLDDIDTSKSIDFDIPPGFDFDKFVNSSETEAQSQLREIHGDSREVPPDETAEATLQATEVSSAILNANGNTIVVNTPHGPALLLANPSSFIPSATIPPASTLPLPRATPNRKFQRWSEQEDELLRQAVEMEANGPCNWSKISSKYFSGERSGLQCKSRWNKSLRPGLVVGSWQPGEDAIIVDLRQKGWKWSEIAEKLPGRIGEHVRDRYVNFLDPSLKKTPWTDEEDTILYEQQKLLGNKWAAIAKLIPGRSENSVKNRWHNAKMTSRRKQRKCFADKNRKVKGLKNLSPQTSDDIDVVVI
eukprot:Nitzschia sp. Nitz4//scaffold156_size52432//45393//46640//NITZ4_006832-RA/size52432-processed-gene-0.55-mRNA-1//-1//CDS//3329537430//1239//frame0